MYSLFGGNLVTQKDIVAIQQYTNLIKSGVPTGKAWSQTMTNCSVAAKQQVLQCKNNTKALEELTVAQQANTASAKAGAVAMKALSIAGNMLVMTLISIAISKVVEGFDYLIHRSERLKETLDESIDAFESTTSEIETLEGQVESLAEKIEELQKLKDAGTISIADDEELKKLKEENDELERQIALLQDKQIREGKQVLKDAEKQEDDYVQSRYSLGNKVTPAEELWGATQAYIYAVNSGNDALAKEHGERAVDMYEKIQPTLEAYRSLEEAGYTLSESEQKHFEELKKGESAYLMYTYLTNNTKEAFVALNEEMQRSVLLRHLVMEKGMTEEQAGFVLDNVQPEDYEGLWDAKFTPPALTDYATAEEYGKAYAEAWLSGVEGRVEEQPQNPDEITDSFASIFNSSDFSDTKQSLLELAKSGQLTNKALSSDDYSDFIDKLEEIGISADEAKTEILSLLDATEKLSGASKSISGLENAYNEFKEKGYVLAETIESIPDVFRELETYDFDVFENIIGNPKNIVQMQGAFNDLVTAYISEMAVLSDVSETEAQRFISNLEEMGVTNADTVVNSVLALNDSMKATAKEAESTAQEINEFLVNVKGKAASATNDLTNCTWSEIQALIEEGNKFGFTTNKIEEFAMKKIWANRNSINTSEDVKQLLAVAKACGLAIGYISTFNASKQLINGAGLLANNSTFATDALLKGLDLGTSKANILNNLLKQIEAEYSFETPEVEWSAPTSSSNKNSSSSSSSKEAEKTAETYDWIEKLLERIQSRIDSLDKTASSTYRAWSTRNKALLDELKEVNGEIKAQQKAYDVYMAKANSVGLSEHYKQLVQNGDYSIEDISDDTLKNQISEYEEWYNKAMDCSDAIDDLKNNILELTTTQFENVFNEYEDILSGYKHQVEMLQTYIDQTEAKGYVVSGNYYKQLIETEKLNIKMLQDEYAKLKDSLQLSVDTGKIVAYSDAWYDMVDNIRNVQKSIEDANTSLIDYQTTLRELEWESFDRFMDKISSIKDESDFLIELMSDKDMFNEDGITDEGQATLGLHAINYNVYLSKAEEYAKKLKDINEEIANDPNNQTLLERRQELLELQQEAILASKDEQQAIRNLVQDGYDVFLESLQKIIDKRKDMLKDIKSLHDFEKEIGKQTSEVARLEKILKAYEGDNSEEARAKIQEYKVSLEEAESALEETEYDKYIQDQEKMLDTIYSQAEEFVNQRLDDLSQLVSDVIDSTNENASEINETIKESADDVGYTISSKLSNVLTSASNGVADLVSNYNDNFLETMTTLQSTVDAIRNLIAGESNSDNLNNGDKYNSDEKELSSPQDRWTKDENNNWNYYENGEQVKDAWTKYEKDDKWYHLGDSGVMDTNTWIKNKSGTWSYVDGTGAAVTSWHKLDWQGKQDWYNFDDEGNMLENQWIDDYFVGKDGKMKTNTWIGHNGKYYWVGADGKWLDKPGWSLDYKPNDGLPLYEYAKGSKKIPEDQLAWTQEEGTEIIRRASDGALLTPLGQDDMVFTNEASRKLWEFSQDPEGYMAKLGLSGLKPVEFAIPNISSMMDIPNIDKVSMVQNVSFDFGDIQMYGVNNTEEFAKQLRNTITTDTKTQKLLTEKIGSSFLGRTDRSNFYR